MMSGQLFVKMFKDSKSINDINIDFIDLFI